MLRSCVPPNKRSPLYRFKFKLYGDYLERVGEWKEFCRKYKLRYAEEQEEYYKRTKKGLEAGKIMLNPAYMGIGKTVASAAAVKGLIDEGKISSAIVCVPKASIKNEWIAELNRIGADYAVFYSKSECCIAAAKGHTTQAGVYEYCRKLGTTCKYRTHLQEEDNFTGLCEKRAKKLEFPLDVRKFNENESEAKKPSCLYTLLTCRGRSAKIIVCDYFYVLSPSQRSAFVKHVLGKDLAETALIIDEAHLLPSRAKEFNSRKMTFPLQAELMLEEVRGYFSGKSEEKEVREGVELFVEGLRNAGEVLLKALKHTGKEEEKVTYKEFAKAVDYCSGHCGLGYETVREKLAEIGTELVNNGKGRNACLRFVGFLGFWEKEVLSYSSANTPYVTYLSEGMEEGEVKVNLDCLDSGIFLAPVWEKFKSVSLQSGTLSPSELFEAELGVGGKRAVVHEPLSLWSLKDNVVVFPPAYANMGSAQRGKTLAESTRVLGKTIKLVRGRGRTLIFTQSKAIAEEVKDAVSSGNDVYDLTVLGKEFARAKRGFDCSEQGVGVLHMFGQLEGVNFKELKNLVVFGCPIPQVTLYQKSLQEYYNGKYLGKGFLFAVLYPMLSRVEQGCARGKRKPDDDPLIILWDERFGKGTGAAWYSHLPEGLKGKICAGFEELKEALGQGARLL